MAPVHMFSPKMWVKNFSLLPVVGCVGAGCALASVYMAYMCATKPDVSFRPSRWLHNAPYKEVEPTELRRLMGFTQPIPSNPELDALRKELHSYKS